MAVMSILLWLGIISMVYPALGINRIPDGLLDKVRNEYVVLFAGPLPAMLPIARLQFDQRFQDLDGLMVAPLIFEFPAKLVTK